MPDYNFAQKPIFSGLRFFTEPDISDSGLMARLFGPEKLVMNYIHPKVIL